MLDRATITANAAADASQAAYFRECLTDELEDVTQKLAVNRARLHARSLRGDKPGSRSMARLRAEIRELEARERDLNRLISALASRFSHVWPAAG